MVMRYLVDSVYCKQNNKGTYKMKQNMQNQTTSELYTDDEKSKYYINSNNVLKSAKNIYG